MPCRGRPPAGLRAQNMRFFIRQGGCLSRPCNEVRKVVKVLARLAEGPRAYRVRKIKAQRACGDLEGLLAGFGWTRAPGEGGIAKGANRGWMPAIAQPNP
jgi:hypothetical protein